MANTIKYTDKTLSYQSAGDLDTPKKVIKEAVLLRYAIVNKKQALFNNIVKYSSIETLQELDHFGYNALEFARRHGDSGMSVLISRRFRKEFIHKQ